MFSGEKVSKYFFSCRPFWSCELLAIGVVDLLHSDRGEVWVEGDASLYERVLFEFWESMAAAMIA